jgi:hypothetical protein
VGVWKRKKDFIERVGKETATVVLRSGFKGGEELHRAVKAAGFEATFEATTK